MYSHHLCLVYMCIFSLAYVVPNRQQFSMFYDVDILVTKRFLIDELFVVNFLFFPDFVFVHIFVFQVFLSFFSKYVNANSSRFFRSC